MYIKCLKNRQNIRKSMRLMRQSLTVTKQYDESIKIAKLAYNSIFFKNAINIAVFFPFDGEINTYPLILNLWLNKKNVFLPVIDKDNYKKLFFVHFTSDSILHLNQYNIFEPLFHIKDSIEVSNLDIVIVPLVAFDKKGIRLGMGGGFYDVCLENWRKKTLPIGYSYDFQFVDTIPVQSWDVSLPVIFTPNKIWFF